MSLVGNLEDLSLGDILQIISLSQKSGVLALHSDQGAGRIVFRGGLVQAACIKGWPDDLRSILVDSGFIESTAFDEAATRARETGAALEEVVAEAAGLGRERVDALVQEAVEAAILEMFLWQRGDFSFDVRLELGAEDPTLLLSSGLNAQYLAMEGLRLRDERARDSAAAAGLEEDEALCDLELSTAELLGPEEAGGCDALDEISEAGPRGGTGPERPDGGIGADGPTAADVVVAGVLERDAEDESDALEVRSNSTPARRAESSAADPTRAPAVVVIDPDVAVLEWVKLAIREDYARVHVFQQAEQGLARIRQYLVRGERPLVLLSSEAEVDPLSGIRGLPDFVKRLKAQAHELRVIALREEDPAAAAAPAGVDAVLGRPGRRALKREVEGSGGEAARAFAGALALEASGRSAGASPVREPGPTDEGRRAPDRLEEASPR